MNKITQTEFRDHMGKYLDRVAQGERFQITRNGNIVAGLHPIPEKTTPSWKRAAPAIKLPNGVSAAQLLLDERDEEQ
jgi:antitoxin (DNA-binding transcriptional repressor) of toxin-antitoxin stability system